MNSHKFWGNINIWFWGADLNPAGGVYNICYMNSTPFLNSKQFWILKYLAPGVSDKRLYPCNTFLMGLCEDCEDSTSDRTQEKVKPLLFTIIRTQKWDSPLLSLRMSESNSWWCLCLFSLLLHFCLSSLIDSVSIFEIRCVFFFFELSYSEH